MNILAEKIIKKTHIKAVEGDITQIDCDAIINAANSYLQHGGGVALAIVRAGGSTIQKESNEIIKKRGPLKTGEAVITSSGNLKAKFIIHTVGPIWGEGDEEDKLKRAIISALEIAKGNKLKSISIPAVSCGIFGFPKEKGTKIIFRTVKDFILNNDTPFDEIFLIGRDSEIPELFKMAIQND
jgi:O-acetyl-ADP-ribose deacetylase (regulator of RNase III)